MKKPLFAFMLTLALISLGGCSKDDFRISLYDHLVGRTWVGDCGMLDNNNQPLMSSIYFGVDLSGHDDTFYEQGSLPGPQHAIRWDCNNQTLYIDYPRTALKRELRQVVYKEFEISGDLYIDTEFYQSVTLYMK